MKRGRVETREQLVEAALELFAQKGYRGTSVRDLAHAAGVTTGAFYSNFQSKRDIYIAVIDQMTNTVQKIIDELTRDTIESIRKKGVKGEYEIFRRPIIRLLDESRRHEALLHILRREGLGQDPEFQRDIDRVWERFVEMARRALDMFVEAGFAKPYDTELLARALASMFIAISIYDQKTKGRRRQDIVSLIAAVAFGGASKWVVWRELESKLEKESQLDK